MEDIIIFFGVLGCRQAPEGRVRRFQPKQLQG